MIPATAHVRPERMNGLQTRKMILPHVYLTCVQSEKFKTGCLSLSLLRPLCRAEAAANALIPAVLLRGCREHPDMQRISSLLNEHYGAGVGVLIRKKGEVQATGFYADFLEDRYALEGEQVLEPVARLLGQLLLEPVLEEGRFAADFVESEKQNLRNTVEARVNDKRSYVVSQLLRTMCDGETYGIPRLGDAEDLKELDAAKLYDHYCHILAHSRVELFYHGSCAASEVEVLLTDVLRKLPRGEVDGFSTEVRLGAGEVREVRETMDVTQGKLAMGLRLGCTAADPTYPAALLMNAVFGAGVTSKLFLNVREKLSLCYYASSSLEKFKGVMVISSGVEPANFETAKNEILRQLDACRQGEISEEELESARTYLLSSLKTGMDSPARLDDYSFGQVILGLEGSMEDLACQLQTVTKAQVAQAAQRVALDTIYFIEGAAE